MRLLVRFVVILILGAFFVACTPEESIPTLVPTITPAPPTETLAPPTLTPTLAPTANIPRTTAPTLEEQAYIRFIHASTAIPAVDFYIEDLNFTPYMEFGLFTEFTELTQGTYTLSVVSAGQPKNNAWIQQSFTIKGQERLTVGFTGTAEAPRLLFHIENTAPLSNNESRLSMMNLLENGSGQSVTLQQGTTLLLPETASGRVSASVSVPSDELRYNVRSNGQIIGSNTLKLRPRQAYLFVITTNPNDPTKAQIFTLSNGVQGVASVRVISMVASVTLDVFLGTTSIAENTSYGVSTVPIRVSSGTYELLLFADDVDRSTVAPLLASVTTIAPDDNLVFIIIGEANNLRVVLYRPSSLPVTSGFARFTFLNTLPTVPRVQLQTAQETNYTLNYGQLLEAGAFPTGDFPMVWYAVQSGEPIGEPLEFVRGFIAEEGKNYLYLFSGNGEQPPILLADSVEIVTPTPIPAENATPLPMIAPVWRMINAVEGLNVELRVDDVTTIAQIAYQTSTPPLTLNVGERVFTVHNADTGQLLARLVTTLSENTRTIAVITGRADIGYTLYSAPDDSPLQNQGLPTARLINLSETDTRFGLAVGTTQLTLYPDPNATPEIGEDGAPIVAPRLSIPFGLRRLANDIEMGQFSVSAPLDTGLQDIFIIDNVQTGVANIRPDVPIEMGKHYEIIAIQQRNTQDVRAFVVLPPSQ